MLKLFKFLQCFQLLFSFSKKFQFSGESHRHDWQGAAHPERLSRHQLSKDASRWRHRNARRRSVDKKRRIVRHARAATQHRHAARSVRGGTHLSRQEAEAQQEQRRSLAGERNWTALSRIFDPSFGFLYHFVLPAQLFDFTKYCKKCYVVSFSTWGLKVFN